MSTDEALQEYVSHQLPDIYRQILGAFSRIEPTRKAGYGLALQTLFADFSERNLTYTFGQLIQACDQLAQRGLVQVHNRVFVHPTESGERLIRIISGHEVPQETVPPLPPLPA